MKKKISAKDKFLADVIGIISQSKENAIRSVDFERVLMYWKLGERILVEEQQGKKRAEYGTYLLKNLADKLEPQFGSGFSYRQLARARQFYKIYPIVSALRTQFNWMQYKLLIHINDPDKREYYELEALHNAWNGRELKSYHRPSFMCG